MIGPDEEKPAMAFDVAVGYKGNEWGGQTYWIHVQSAGPANGVLSALQQEFNHALSLATQELEEWIVTEAKDERKGVATQSRPDGQDNTGSGSNMEGRDNSNTVENQQSGSGNTTPVGQ